MLTQGCGHDVGRGHHVRKEDAVWQLARQIERFGENGERAGMKVGITILSGLVGEFVGWEPTRAWDRAVEMGRVAERLGFSYAWIPDHLQVVRGPADGPTFEAFTLLSAIAAETHRIRLGPGVACAAFRNPALLAKIAMTLDVAFERPRRSRDGCRLVRGGVAGVRIRLPVGA